MPENYNNILSEEMVKILTKIRRKDAIASWILDLNEVRQLNMADNTSIPRSAIADAAGTLYVIPAGKPITANRTIIKHGRWVNTLAEKEQVEFYGRDVEVFVQLLKATINPLPDDGTLQIVSGDDIMLYYHEDRYDYNQNLGALGNSCMRQSVKQTLIKFYASNPHRIRMLILRSPTNKDKIIARALIWETNKGTFMDRVYSDNEHVPKFTNYAERNGFWYCSEQGRGEKNLYKEGVSPVNSKNFMVTDLTFPEGRNIKLPYMDTFFHAYRDLGILAGGYKVFKYGYLGKAQDQNGSVEGYDDGYVTCNYYGGIRIPSSECIVGYASYKNYKDHISDNFPKHVVFIDEAIDEYFHVNNMVIGLNGEKYIIDSPSVVWLTGEKYNLPVQDFNAVQCISDGLWYYRQYHNIKRYTLQCKDGAHIVNILDYKAKPFFEKHDATFNQDNEVVQIATTYNDFLKKINVDYKNL